MPFVSVLPSGRMLLSWLGNRRLEVRARSASGRLGRPQILTRDLQDATNQVPLTAGRGAIGWSDRDPGVSTIRIAQADRHGRFGAPKPPAACAASSTTAPRSRRSPARSRWSPPAPLNNPEPVHWKRIPLAG